MDKERSTKTNDNRFPNLIPAIRIIFFAALFLSFAGLVYLSGIDHSNPVESREPVFIEEWSVTGPDGNEFRAGSSYRNDGKRTGVFTMVSTLPQISSDDSWFCFIIGGDVSVYIDGELRKDFSASRDIAVPGGCVKRFYMRVPVTMADSGAEVRLVRRSTTRSGFVYQNTFVAESGTFFTFMMSRYGLSLMLELLLFIFAAVIVITGLGMEILYRRRIEMLYGAMSILVIAGWLITNSYLYPFLFGHYHIDGLMNYMLCLLMPFGLAIYLDLLQHGRYRMIMSLVLLVSTVNLFVWPVLHFTGILPFPDALLLIDAFLGAELLTVASVMITDLIRGGMRSYRFTAIGFSGFLACGLGEIVVLNFLPVINGDILMLTGLAFMLAFTVIQQIVDLKRTREEGQRAINLSEAKTRFLAGMSHEIRTPINSILGMNEMILRDNRDPVIRDYAETVKSSGQMLLMLVNDVLDFSRIESGRLEINEAEFTVSSLLDNIMPMLRERAEDKRLKLRMFILNEVPDGMISDEFRIRQILINLINNAIKYTDAGSVSLMLGGDYAGDESFLFRMIVKDTGRGIREEDQKHLFEAFTRADMKKNRNIEGTGLGLAIVKNIVDRMGGEISVSSRYGEGSEFTVYLPVRIMDRTPLREDYEKQAKSRPVSESEAGYIAPEACVLAVDDNNSNLKIVKLFLKRVRIVPELCGSGSEAVELCRKKKYDVILMDHMMPDPDGITALGMIRSDLSSPNRDTPVVVLTANAVAGSGELYARVGFADYLTKPIDFALLEKTVRKYLPPAKVLPVTDGNRETAEQPAQGSDGPEQSPEEPGSAAVPAGDPGPSPFRRRMEQIEGLDYDMALFHAGGDEGLLEEMVRAIVSECAEKIDSMREDMAAADWAGYRVTAHSIKGLLSTVGLQELSERAKRLETAAANGDAEFVRSDSEAFLAAYREVCERMQNEDL